MFSFIYAFISLMVLGLIGIVLTPVLFVGWYLFKLVFKVVFFFGMIGMALSMLHFL